LENQARQTLRGGFDPESQEEAIFDCFQARLSEDFGLLQFVNGLGSVTLTFVHPDGTDRRLVWAADETGRKTFLAEAAA
jgi:hypothetical protein